MKRKQATPVYKEYSMGQIMLLPVDLNELIPANHLVRVVHEFVERMNLAVLEARYKGGGTSSYHPKMMLKVYLYAYTQKIFSSRRIAKALRESIPFLWLSGNNRPDFRTINYFRGVILKGLIEKIFVELLVLLVEEGYIKLEDYFVDGTKLEANANKYSFVWAKSTAHYEKQLTEKVKALFEQIEQLNAAEDARYGEHDLEEVGQAGPVSAENMARRVAELNESLKRERQASEVEDEQAPPDQQPPQDGGAEPLSRQMENLLEQVKHTQEQDPDNQTLAKAAKVLETDYLPRAMKYETQKRKLAGRNSYSKTDVDATFMRMKDDAMRNGQLKAAYNIQIGTEHQFVVGFSLHQNPGDTNCLIPHLDKVKSWLGRLPQNIDSDAGYGSEENYAYLSREKAGNYLKYAGFDREQKKRYKPNPFQAENMPYDAQRDEFTCPNGRRLVHVSTRHEKTEHGYLTEKQVYACQDCQGCPLKEKCTRAEGNRQLRVSFQLWKYRKQARQNLLSEQGQRLRSQRGVDVETVFGRIKEDWGFRRFLLRGLEKVTVEWGLLCIAHNLAKVWSTQNVPDTLENLAAV